MRGALITAAEVAMSGAYAATPTSPPASHVPRWVGSMGRVSRPARYDTPAVNWPVLCTDAGTSTTMIPRAAAGGKSSRCADPPTPYSGPLRLAKALHLSCRRIDAPTPMSIAKCVAGPIVNFSRSTSVMTAE